MTSSAGESFSARGLRALGVSTIGLLRALLCSNVSVAERGEGESGMRGDMGGECTTRRSVLRSVVGDSDPDTAARNDPRGEAAPPPPTIAPSALRNEPLFMLVRDEVLALRGRVAGDVGVLLMAPPGPRRHRGAANNKHSLDGQMGP